MTGYPSMRTLLSAAALLFSLFILVGCGGAPVPEPIDEQAEELTEEDEAAEMELNEVSDAEAAE